MGAGVAACIAMLLRLGDADVLAAASEGIRKAVDEDGASEEGAAAATRNVTRAICHCFAAPSTCSLDLSNAAREYVTAVVAGKDVIPRLCYGSVRRLLRRLNSAAPSQPMMRAISNALGGRDKGGSQGIGRRGGGGDGDGDESPLYVAEEDARAYEEDEAEITGRMSALHDFHAPTASDKPKIPEPEPRDADESESDLAPDETDRSASNAPPPKPPDGDGAAAGGDAREGAAARAVGARARREAQAESAASRRGQSGDVRDGGVGAGPLPGALGRPRGRHRARAQRPRRGRLPRPTGARHPPASPQLGCVLFCTHEFISFRPSIGFNKRHVIDRVSFRLTDELFSHGTALIRRRPHRGGAASHGVHGDPALDADDDGPHPHGVHVRDERRRRGGGERESRVRTLGGSLRGGGQGVRPGRVRRSTPTRWPCYRRRTRSGWGGGASSTWGAEMGATARRTGGGGGLGAIVGAGETSCRG